VLGPLRGDSCENLFDRQSLYQSAAGLLETIAVIGKIYNFASALNRPEAKMLLRARNSTGV
jgi:hypothetical protein